MIIAAVVAMAYFLSNVLRSSIIDNQILYWLLITALLFTCLKLLHEWYHYFYITVPVKPPLNKQYTVDIFTTFCAGEPYEMMLETLTAIQAIKYPHSTYLCDEADDPYLKSLCQKLGINHITRTHKINAKAGNINNALQYASGEICVILDPDHVPFPNFLEPIISHFNDPEVGFVQIVQAYKNYHQGLIAKGAAQQTFQFYGPMMMTMNRYGTVLAIGANCTFRRKALDSIGGHAAGLAEDMHTAMQLHAKGWKSVYVPEVLARGLVPSTLSAYYSQQLKWSRGVFELLITSYPKLFKQFTWRQKLHYGIIPFYYLSGLIVLINFLIPVLSLFLEVNPIKMDFQTFALIGFPLFAQIILVRNYVQRWVMEDEERGFHIVGGLLMIGTWWIFITGLVYTIFRKKVPYVPTPKNDEEENNWPLNIPNIIVLLISLSAIIYGLYIDWNPYTLIMAGLAGVNCLILTFNIIASRQLTFRNLKERHNFLNVSARHIFNARKTFRGMRVKAYGLIRSAGLFLTLLTIGTAVYMIKTRRLEISEIASTASTKNFFLTGIFAPETTNGLSSVKLVRSYNTPFDIISLYIAWGDKNNSTLPLTLIDSIYNNGSIPMITWEPWQNLFDGNSQSQDKMVFKRIANGDYDAYLTRFARQARSLDRPVYIRFAHEADNPFYPWSAKGGNTPDDFKTAWRYVHNLFSKEGAHNVLWVWNPWKPDAVKEFFPGKNYVDWIGITSLNYGKHGPDSTWYSMEQLYTPFHKQPVIISGIPVMLAEMGSLGSQQQREEWFEEASKTAKMKFPEIKAFVLFNSGLDKNIPDHTNMNYLDWRLKTLNIFSAAHSAKPPMEPVKHLNGIFTDLKRLEKTRLVEPKIFDTVKGVTYSKGLDWTSNYNTVRQKDISADFKAMKQMGFNAVKRYGPDVFSNNILSTARNENLKVNYAFYIPDEINFLTDQKLLNDLDKKILSTIEKLKGQKTVMAWNLGNIPLQKFERLYPKTELIYHQYACAKWLRELVSKIKVKDPLRPLSVDVEVSESLAQTLSFLEIQVPDIDYYGFVISERSPNVGGIENLGVPYYISKINPGNYLERPVKHEGFFISDWQDQQRRNLVTFDGLKDNWGRNKISFYRLSARLKNLNKAPDLPRVRILKPAVTIYDNGKYKYHALVDVKNEWKLAASVKTGLTYDWYLIKTDGYGNGISMSYISSGPSVSVKMPQNHKYYQLYLNASKGHDVATAKSSPNIPLIVNPALIKLPL